MHSNETKNTFESENAANIVKRLHNGLHKYSLCICNVNTALFYFTMFSYLFCMLL